MKIAVFGIRTIPSTYSGYETFCTELLPELVRRGHEVTLFIRDEPGKTHKPYKGVKRVRLPSVKTKQLDTLSHSFAAAWASRRGGFDVALTFNVANAPAIGLMKSSIPRVLNVDGQEWKRGKWGVVGRNVFRGCAQLSKHTATELITDCEAMQRIYSREFNAQSNVIAYPSVELLDGSLSTVDEALMLKEVDLEPLDYFLVGGRLVPENNIERIVRSYLKTELPNPIAVMGEANYDSPVQRELFELAMADERVKLLGHVVDRPMFGVLLKNARCYFHGHSVGGINPSLVEALGVGAFIAANDTEFNREGLADAGVYFADPDRAAEQALESFSDAGMVDRKRMMAERRSGEEFSLHYICDQYEEVMLKAIEKKQREPA